MSSDVVLTSALRSNLLSLQNTQSLIDRTQDRLATGLKVSSALDNPQSFFTAQGLNNRAGDLSRLLDGIGQSIRTIEEADNGISALTNLVDQANSIAEQAQAALSNITSNAVASSDFTGLDLDATLDSQSATGIVSGDQFTIKVGTEAAETFTIAADTTAESLVATINNRASETEKSFEASIVNGQIQISSTNGDRLILADASGDNALSTLGFFSQADADALTETFTPGSTLEISLTDTGEINANSLLFGTNEFTDSGTTVDTFTIDPGSNGSPVTLFTGEDADTLTIDDFIDLFNSNTTTLAGITASFDDSTDTISITFDSDVVDTAIFDGTANLTADFGQGQTVNATALTYNTSSGSSSNSTLLTLQNDYNEVLSQIDTIVEDANYRGTNLLNGDDLVTQFNEDNTSSLTTTGVNFTSSGLGLNAADFTSDITIQTNIDETRAALDSIREFGATIANDLSIIQTRQNFTTETIGTLEAGADDLTVADQNEEGANLLALQTRQQLGTTALSLAAQSQQAVLRLF